MVMLRTTKRLFHDKMAPVKSHMCVRIGSVLVRVVRATRLVTSRQDDHSDPACSVQCSVPGPVSFPLSPRVPQAGVPWLRRFSHVYFNEPARAPHRRARPTRDSRTLRPDTHTGRRTATRPRAGPPGLPVSFSRRPSTLTVTLLAHADRQPPRPVRLAVTPMPAEGRDPPAPLTSTADGYNFVRSIIRSSKRNGVS